jgi:DNA-binding MarR family transcriptional regulator
MVQSAPARRPVDLDDPGQLEIALRIGSAWKELRRGAAMSTVRDWFYGTGDDALELGQVDTLDLLAAEDSWRMTDLADALRVDPSTATRAVQRLVRAGLAERRQSDEDGRVVMVSATAAGRARHEAVAGRRRKAMETMLAEFDDAERQQLADLLERFVAALDHLADQLP